MSGDPEHSGPPAGTERLKSVLDYLACPACYGGLRLERESLSCKGCGRVYPIVDGIPVLTSDPMDLPSRE